MFIVIEGIDGAGCQTQAELLTKRLTEKKYATCYFKFPHYDTPEGKVIKKFLYRKRSLLNAEEQFLLYSLQFVFDSSSIKESSKRGIAIGDRFFTTTLCYQTLEGIPEKVALRFAQDFGIIKPDIVFFLDVSPETAIRWKHGEQKKLNFREKDGRFIRKTYQKYLELVKRNVWTKWIKIDGDRPKEDVHTTIIEEVLKLYKK